VNVGDNGQALFYLLLLILPLSSLLARRIPLRSVLGMALAWIAIFAVGLLAVSQRDRLTPVWQATRGLVMGNDQIVSGREVRIRKGDDGHFWADVTVNGVDRRMLIDSGATVTALSSDTAQAAKLDLGESEFATMLETANGPVAAKRSTVAKLTVGAITAHGLPVVVSDSFGRTDVLGMNFLSRLKAWRVEGDWLVLTPDSDKS
jgi:aspartyl protease family protein